MIFNQDERQIILKYRDSNKSFDYADEAITMIRYHSSHLFNAFLKSIKIREVADWLSTKLEN